MMENTKASPPYGRCSARKAQAAIVNSMTQHPVKMSQSSQNDGFPTYGHNFSVPVGHTCVQAD
jgi:hypothetical protein